MTRGTAISVFSGAGGLDLGAEQAGFRVVAAVEQNTAAAATMEANFTHLRSPVIRADLRTVPTRDILAAGGISRPDLLLGGPPCTPFSKSGFWLEHKRAGADPDADLLGEYVRVLRETRPRWFVLENAYALTFANKASAPAFAQLQDSVRAAGYACAARVLLAADYGVPQARPRLFVIGAPYGTPLRFPEPTHGGTWEKRATGNPARPHVTAGEALAGLADIPEPGEAVNGKWGHLLPGVPPGGNYLHYTERGGGEPLFGWRSRYWSFLLKLDPGRPSPVIQAQPGPYVGPFHWDSRRLRVPEIKRLFTFPDRFTLAGSRRPVQVQLGNAVPPLLAEHVIRALTRN